MLSKRSTLIAITVMAALSIEVGCGDGSHRTSVRKGLTGNGPTTTQKPVFDAQGKPVIDPATGKQKMQTVPVNSGTATGPVAPGTVTKNPDGTSTRTNADGTTTLLDASGKEVPKPLNVQHDKNLDVILKSEQDQLNGNAVTREALVAGTYELQTLTTSAHVLLTTGEETRAIQNSTLQNSGNNGLQLQAGDMLSAGTLPTFVDNGRRVDVATSFKVDLTGGKWTPNRDQAANVTVQDMVTTPKDGKAVMNDSLFNAEVNPASILGILATGTLQKNNSYLATDSQGVQMVLRLFKTDTQLKVAISFEEKRAAGKGTGEQNISFDRNMFFTYKITADPNGGKPAADDKINVTQVPAGQTLGGATDTGSAPPPSTGSN